MKLTILIGITFFSLITKAQSIELSLINSAGGSFNSQHENLTWTVGEVITESFSTDNLYLTQGFLQTNINKTSISTKKSEISEINIYPNPASTVFFIDYTSGKEPSVSHPTELSLIDINGKVVFSKDLNQKLTSITINELKTGVYLIKLTKLNTAYIKTHILQITN